MNAKDERESESDGGETEIASEASSSAPFVTLLNPQQLGVEFLIQLGSKVKGSLGSLLLGWHGSTH